MKDILKTLVTVLLVVFTFNGYTQTISKNGNIDNNLKITISNNPDTLVADFIEYGVTVSNVTYTGAGISLGNFTCDSMNVIGMQNGIILSSGNVMSAASNANYTASTSTGGGSDPDLYQLAGETIGDAAVLEFDLIPDNNFLAFNFVFGSEEYHEYVGSPFNDVFGFFITGPNPAGPDYDQTNIALIPETDTYISIATVNNGASNNGPCINCEYLIDNTGGQYVVYDAFTTVIPVNVFVVPNQTYHLKIAIGDCYDRIYDSGIFLQSPSLKSYHVVGIEEPEKTSPPNVYPNPASDQIVVRFNNQSAQACQIDVVDLTGRQVLMLMPETRIDAGIFEQAFDISTLKNGIYTYRILSSKDNQTGIFSKQ
ncbi:MAG: hypothetical protein FD170_1521 [Bacteroidetes bacterium]|nr:MAG: hypothetical protein FD170_1521 [Bacteroidota bacterium]